MSGWPAKRPPIWKFIAEAKVDGRLVAEAEIGASLIDGAK